MNDQPDVESVLASLGMDREEFDEPSLRQKLEATKTAIAFVKLIDAGNLRGLLDYYSGLEDYELAYGVGALGQLALIGVNALAVLGGRDFDEQCAVMEAELATVLGGQ